MEYCDSIVATSNHLPQDVVMKAAVGDKLIPPASGNGKAIAAEPARQNQFPASCGLALFCFLTMIGVLIVAGEMLTSASAKIGFSALAATAMAMAVGLVVRVRAWVRAKPPAPFSRDHLRFLTGTAALAGAIFLACSLMIHLIDTGGDDKRCINGQNMTVVPSSWCQNSESQGDTGGGDGGYLRVEPEWYYGGTGTQIGEQVQGGSTISPADSGNGGGGGSGDSGGDDSGGDGGDGGD
jgi:uncharacterized membrane protein YgcG